MKKDKRTKVELLKEITALKADVAALEVDTDRLEQNLLERKLNVYRDLYFAQATSTEPADRPRAEAAARRLAEIGGVEVREVVWVTSPAEGAAAYDVKWDSLRASLRDSLRASLGASLWDSLRVSLRNSLRVSLRNSLRNSLRASLGASLRASLWASLWASLGASLWDTGWLAYYTYAVEVLGIECSDEHRELMRLHNEIAASCFALWLMPGAVILCERPETVEIVDGRLVGLTWKED